MQPGPGRGSDKIVASVQRSAVHKQPEYVEDEESESENENEPTQVIHKVSKYMNGY